MKIFDQVSFALFLLALGITIGWAGITSGYKWRDKKAFDRALATHSEPTIWPVYVLAVVRFRPEILVISLFAAAGLLKTTYEFFLA